ncbi:unnamed protein product [Peronospora belbahrii]|uniref:Secreted protein n=1 Tax=Peronospora belbahrii TaxID=622444 RepID=A0AAU9KP79_9STRA|nr:unnamed protein product [Peronospora belbahrii]
MTTPIELIVLVTCGIASDELGSGEPERGGIAPPPLPVGPTSGFFVTGGVTCFSISSPTSSPTSSNEPEPEAEALAESLAKSLDVAKSDVVVSVANVESTVEESTVEESPRLKSQQWSLMTL